MVDKLLDVRANLQQIAKIKTKLGNYPSYAISEGLDAVANYLNGEAFDIYPPESNEPFMWSSEKQRRAYFATNGFGRGIPTHRTYELKNSGEFKTDKKYSSLYVYYENSAPYARWVIGQFTQIIGHIKRGWKPVNTFVVDNSDGVIKAFSNAVHAAWEKMSGEAPGL